MSRAAGVLTALVLAGGGAGDPVARAGGVANKCLAPINGRPLLSYALNALVASEWIGRIFVSADDTAGLETAPGLADFFRDGRVAHIPAGASAPESVAMALDDIDAPYPLLVTTGDNAFLTPAIIAAFAGASRNAEAALTVGLAPEAAVRLRDPAARRTFLRFRDGRYSGCNLFALASPAARVPVLAWRTVTRDRKAPVRLAGHFGLRALMLYALNRLTLDEAFALVSSRLGVMVRPVILDQGEAAIDVDAPADLELARRALAERA